MASNQSTPQVSPAFLPDPTGNPSVDLTHLGYRLATLAALPSSCPVSVIRLAESGFYSRGHGDEVICYSCGARHSGWRAEEKPVDIHRQLSPSCQHVLQKDRESTDLARRYEPLGENRLANAPVETDGVHEANPMSQSHPPESDSEPPGPSASTTSTTNTTGSERGHSPSSSTKPRSSGAPSPASSRTTAVHPSEATAGEPAVPRPPMYPQAMLDLGGAVYPAFNSRTSRRRTFSHWDESQAPPLTQILLSGMFYAGYRDCVRCFYCGVGLKNWVVTDNVWDEHVRWRPECGYLRAVKGNRFIRETQRRLGIVAVGVECKDYL